MKPIEMKTTLKDMQIFAMFLRGEVYKTHEELSAEIAVTEEPVPFDRRLTLEYKPVRVGDKWSDKLFSCGWMHVVGKCQPKKENRERVIQVDVSGEGCLFDAGGTPVRGLTNVSSTFDRSIGLPGKTTLFLDEIETKNDCLDLWIEIGNNDLFGANNGGTILQCHTAYLNTELRAYYYDLAFLLDYLSAIDDKNPQYYAILYAMQDSAAAVSSEYTDGEIARARGILRPQMAKCGGEEAFLTFCAIGHAHLDLAWLWPIRETKRKLGRTFSNVVANMNRYDDYLFGASQAQQFAWLEELYPALFSKVKQKVAENRLELQGGMWVEADTNVSGGEALIRQMLYGKGYFKEKFGKDMKICWLPDAFGFSGALPQIIKKCGMDYFMTIKISWNEHFEFPHHTFNWEGIDGSKVLVHMPPEGNYNSPASPRVLLEAQGKFAERGKLDRALTLFGIGDGGGGPGRDHIERVRRAENFAGLPKVKQQFAADFFDEIAKDRDKFATWKGEMYMDRHQGTLTSASENKKYNRLLENALLAYEQAAVIASLNGGSAFKKAETAEIWKEVLLYQFHDILPGSSIKRVYDESVPRYKAMLAQLTKSTEQAAQSLCETEPVAFNVNSFEAEGIVEYEGGYYRVKARPLAFTRLGEKLNKFDVKAVGRTLENRYLRAEFAADGSLAKLYDKRNGRESLNFGNVLHVYNEFFDCWDMTASFKKYDAGKMTLQSAKAFTEGDKAVLEQVFTYNDSRLVQRAILSQESGYLDFKCELDWKETKKMLRAEFDPAVKSDFATCDIQFGYIERPTYSATIEQFGKYEVSMHKYADISSRQYGVALLNDSKYAVNVKDGQIGINLLRSQMYPCTDCDKGLHAFSYAVYPHAGDVCESDVIKVATLYNRPLKTYLARETAPLLLIDAADILVESVKFAEKSEDVTVRLFESKKLCGRAKIKLGISAKQVFETDMLENELRQCPIKGGEIELEFTPFEIKTIKIKR